MEYEDLSTTSTFRVWFPTTVTLNATDLQLGLVVPAHSAGDPDLGRGADLQAVYDAYANSNCASFGGRYQQAELSAYATFSCGDAADMAAAKLNATTGDVTALVSFESSAPSVASVDGYTVQGLSDGTTEVGFALPAAGSSGITIQNALTLIVSSTNVAEVSKLTVVVFSGGEWVEDIGSVGLRATPTPQLQLQHVLEHEGESATVLAYALFTDGTYEDVSNELRLTSNHEYVGVASGNTSIYVAVGALPLCFPAVTAAWAVCGATIAEDRAVVMLNMPPPISVAVTADAAKVAKNGDGATDTPFDIASSVTLTVVITFEDLTTQDYSTDSRTLYTVRQDGSETMVEMTDNVLTVLSGAAITDDLSTVTVDVTFPGVYSMNGTVSVLVVELASLTISSVPYPTVDGWPNGDVTTLKLVACSGVFQRLEARATGVLSDGTTEDDEEFYKRVVYSSSKTAVADFDSSPCFGTNCRGLAASAIGSLTMTASFGGLTSALVVTVSVSTTTVTALTVADDVGTASTLVGVVGTQDTLAVTATFDDDTVLVVANEGQTSSDWISPSSFLEFSSDQDAITVSDEGVVTLATNYYATVTLTATDSCGSGVSGTSEVYANLEAETYDVDMGATTGPAFGTVTEGDTFDVDVRIQGSDDYDVTAFQIIVTFDSSVVQVASDSDCAQGDDWSSSFECTTNDPTDEVLLIGSCGLSPSSGCASTGLITVATVTFTAVASGVTDVAGEITKIKDDSTTVSDVVIFAGADVLAVDASRRRRLTLTARPTVAATAAATAAAAEAAAEAAETTATSLAAAASGYLKSAWSWFAAPEDATPRAGGEEPRRLTGAAPPAIDDHQGRSASGTTAADAAADAAVARRLAQDLAALAERFAAPAQGAATRRHHDALVPHPPHTPPPAAFSSGMAPSQEHWSLLSDKYFAT